MVNLTVTRRPFQSPVALAISSPTSVSLLAFSSGNARAQHLTHTLGRETERTDLGSERGRGTDFTTRRTEVDNLNLGGIDLGSFGYVSAWRWREAWLLNKANSLVARRALN